MGLFEIEDKLKDLKKDGFNTVLELLDKYLAT